MCLLWFAILLMIKKLIIYYQQLIKLIKSTNFPNTSFEIGKIVETEKIFGAT